MVFLSVASVALFALKHIMASVIIDAMPEHAIPVDPVADALKAAQTADKTRLAAIDACLTRKKELEKELAQIETSLKTLKYKPTRKARAKKVAAPVPAGAPTE